MLKFQFQSKSLCFNMCKDILNYFIFKPSILFFFPKIPCNNCRNLESNITSMHSLLNRINNTFSKDSSDCLSTLSACLALLRLLTTVDPGEEEIVTRTKVVSREKLRHILLWSPDISHPLVELEVRQAILYHL